MRSLLLLAFFAFATAGCLGVDSPDGALKCSDVAGRACPEGFYCFAGDNTCWRDGHMPDAGVGMPPLLGPEDDMSFVFPELDMSVDDAGDDGGAADLAETD